MKKNGDPSDVGRTRKHVQARRNKALSSKQRADLEEKRDKILSDYKLTNKDRECIRILIDYPDITREELGVLLDCEPNEAGRRRNKKAVRKALIELMEENKHILMRVQKMALHRLMKLVSSPNENVALKACQTALLPMLNEWRLKAENVAIQEIVFRSRIGSQGQLMQDVEKVKSDGKDNTSEDEKTTLDLLAGGRSEQ